MNSAHSHTLSAAFAQAQRFGAESYWQERKTVSADPAGEKWRQAVVAFSRNQMDETLFRAIAAKRHCERLADDLVQAKRDNLIWTGEAK